MEIKTKIIIGVLIVLVVALAGCSSTPSNDTPEVVTPAPVVDESVYGGTCLHKYDASRHFEYRGGVTESSRTMFGQLVVIYTFTTPSGEQVHLTGDEVVNYRCERSQRINTSIH